MALYRDLCIDGDKPTENTSYIVVESNEWRRIFLSPFGKGFELRFQLN